MSADAMPADLIGRDVQDLLGRARGDGQFSAAAWAMGSSAGVQRSGEVGTFAHDDRRPIGSDALFDLASVTKPIVGLALLRLVDLGALDLDATVGEVLEDWPEGPMAHAGLRSLLTHTSGAPGPTPLWREHEGRTALLQALAELEFTAPGSWRYSSMGFIVLGLVAERVAGMSLDQLVAREITEPLGMTSTGYGPVPADRAVATEDCPWRGHVVRGEVHDENAVVLGGIAGHAGLFGTVGDMGLLGAGLLRGDLFTPGADRAMRGADDGRPLGWWPRAQCTYLGDHFGPEAFGHTGFTGTSLVIDPAADRWFVLLTNRVHPSREPRGFDVVRRAFHETAGDAAP
ncbi:MAG: beta-lactamase family protein [Brachybacterium sp.]|uniref:serine hydrolase domain-containing protein n=1 Tax=Brachybacterium sp. TaxID=1891286 RepID=UPI00264A1A80|nr:serine hydrolase domain-containing protein [Brachybacterium sp.]MDN5685384.1 beta-lactamase family protein [Brachybacterium sp.]